MIFLTEEDKEIWKEYTLNMNNLRLKIRKIETKSNTNNDNDNSSTHLINENRKKYIYNDTFNKSVKLLNKKRIEPDGIIDLHGFHLEEAKVKLKKYLFQAFNDNKRNILIITGKGFNKSGLLKREVPIWLDESETKKLLIGYKIASKSSGGEGALIIRLKNKQKVSI